MADIIDINEAWAGHAGLEVERFLKRQLGIALAASEGKFGAVSRIGTDLVFYDEENGNVLGTVSLSGANYTIEPHCNLGQTFFVLADETTKIMSISPTTSVSQFGSQTSENYPETYTYVVAVNTGSGYVNKLSGSIGIGGTASFDIRPFLATGENYIRVSITGESSHQTRSVVYTGTLTTLTLSCSHTWQNVWTQGQDYNITGIRFAGSVVKTLHVSVDDVELLPARDYAANQSYTTTATYYTIPASAFPQAAALRGLRSGNAQSGVHSVKLWMTAQGVSTPVISFNIMCVAEGDSRPLVCVNAITPTAVNYTSGTLFAYAVYNANKVSIDLSATLNSVVYAISPVGGIPITDREAGVQYPFAYSLEVDTGANETKIGSLAISATAYMNETVGGVSTASSIFDNSYSYIATPDYVFYLNAATRDNGAADHELIVNEATPDEHFAASYQAVWSGLSWYNDGWYHDDNNKRALVIPAGCSCVVSDFAPLGLLSSYQNGMTIEMMIQNANPSDYATPVFSMFSGGSTPLGIQIFPTKIIVWGSAERDEDYQMVNISENKITHLCVTFVKGYEGESGKNLCSIYINGISNVNFSFDGTSSFGDGNFSIGQPDTDAYLYKMRVYGFALEPQAVFNNFLNCIFDGIEFTRAELVAKNDVLDGEFVDYYKVKAAGYNTMVVTTPIDPQTGQIFAIPSFYNDQTVEGCSVKFEYAEDHTKDVTVSNVPMDGQGTTSKKYYRWNLRWKTADDTVWTYGDGTSETGKVGHFIKDDVHVRVDRITAKKNVASSPQGHKMGLTGLYNDLFHEINSVVAGLPNADIRVAVYQFPFIGFQFNPTNNTYEFIGVYTAGPDKGSKVTFGYNKSTYPSCLSIEGPNHAPRGTRFLTPWVDVAYDPQEETLTFGGEEGWDVDYVKWETSKKKGTQADWDNIRALYESEWRPAYECVYNNSPYIASAQEVINSLANPSITTLAHLLLPANAPTVKAAFTNNMLVANEYIAFYDTSYELYFFRRSTGQFQSIADYNTETGDSIEHNLLTALSSYLSSAVDPSHPTTAEIIAARAARFRLAAPSYFDMDQTLFHYCFCILYAVTDNFAKNSYPQKFLALTASGAGNRWGWRQDDLDSVLMTDNNGPNTKKYSVEHLDTADNVQIFQGGESALWLIIKQYYEDDARSMMTSIANAAVSIATRLGIQGSGEHESLLNLTSYYCWEKSAKYFPATIYEKERRWTYIEPWILAGKTRPGTSTQYPDTYNGVKPLTQAVGDQFQGERLWMERRIAYIFSKYRVGAFTGDNSGYNAITFTLARDFTFNLKPAIDLYPVVSLARTSDSQGGRTPAGTSVQVSIGTAGGTNNLIHGGDWLAELGDLRQMRLTSRGGSTSIDFFVVAARLQRLKIGDADAANMENGFNATAFGVTSPTLTELDARNTATILNNIDLLGCPRLRSCLFAGSGAAGLLLPVGAKLTAVSFPNGANTVFMHSLPFLTLANLVLPALANITTLYINNCANINPFEVAEDIIETTGERLAYVTLIWRGYAQGSVETILALAQRSGSVEFDGESVRTLGGKPHVEGMVQIPSLYVDDFDQLDIISEEPYQTNLKKALSGLFDTDFYIVYDPNSLYIRFADSEVEAICVSNWGSGGHVTTAQAAQASVAQQFKGKTAITAFKEFIYFTRVTALYYQGFSGCTNLTKIGIPPTVTSGDTQVFSNCTKITEVHITDLNKYLNIAWGQTPATSHPFGPGNGGRLFLNGTEITEITYPNTTTEIKRASLYKHVGLTSIVIPSSVNSISNDAFVGCSGLINLTIPIGCSVALLHNSGAGTGTLTINGNLSGGSAQGYKANYNKIVIIGNELMTGGNTIRQFQSCVHKIHIVKGSVEMQPPSGTYNLFYSGTTPKFIEIMGDFISGGTNMIGSTGNCDILHLGYSQVITAAPEKIPISKVNMVYVGDGSSAEHDDAILALYTAAWLDYTAKLGTWYDYTHSDNANPDYIS